MVFIKKIFLLCVEIGNFQIFPISQEKNLAVKINGNSGAQQEITVSTKVSKEIYHFNRKSKFKSLM